MNRPFQHRFVGALAAWSWLACLVVGHPPLVAQPGAAEQAGDIIGIWRTEPTDTGYANIEIVRRDGELSGVIVELSEPLFPASEGPAWSGKPKVDRNNPDAAKRGQPIVGLEILWGFEEKASGKWHGGRVYDPENGKTYKAKLTLRDDGSLDLRGYVGISLLGRTSTWTRAPQARPADGHDTPD